MARLIRLVLCLVLVGGLVGLSSSTSAASTGARGGEVAPKKNGRKKQKKRSRKNKQSKGKVDMSPLPADKKAEAKISKSLGEGFELLHTRHYSIFYDTSAKDVEVFSGAVERTYRSCLRYTSKLGIRTKLPKRKLISYFFNEFDDYAAFSKKIGGSKPSPNMLGFYQFVTNHTYFYNYRNTPTFKKMRADAEKKLRKLGEEARRGKMNPNQRRQHDFKMREARWILNRTDGIGGGQTEETLQHEVAHQVLFNVGFHSKVNPKNGLINPRWFAEGTAQIFEPLSDGKAANFGQLNKGRLQEYQSLELNGQLVPLRDFVVDIRYFRRADAGGLAYPQSWALVYYLNKTKRKKIAKYVETILDRPKDYKTSHEEELKDFEAAFGKLDKKWERRWRSWMKKVH